MSAILAMLKKNGSFAVLTSDIKIVHASGNCNCGGGGGSTSNCTNCNCTHCR